MVTAGSPAARLTLIGQSTAAAIELSKSGNDDTLAPGVPVSDEQSTPCWWPRGTASATAAGRAAPSVAAKMMTCCSRVFSELLSHLVGVTYWTAQKIVTKLAVNGVLLPLRGGGCFWSFPATVACARPASRCAVPETE